MATTVTIKEVNLDVEFRDKNGVPRTNHKLVYVNDGGREVTRLVFPNQPVYKKLQETGKFLEPGTKVDLSFSEKDEQGFRQITDVAKAGTLVANNPPKKQWSGGGGSFKKAADPDRELSMEISGLMQAIIAKEGMTGLKQKTIEAYTIKKELMAVAKSPTTVSKTETINNEAALHEQKTQAVASYKIEDDYDTNPF